MSTCFLKLHSTCPKEHFELKKLFLKVLFFFQTLRNFERTFTVLGEKVFGRDIKIEKCSFRRIRFIKQSNFWKFSFFRFFRTSNEQLAFSAENFSAGISKMKIAVFVSKDQSKNQTSGKSLFFQILQNFERTFTVLGEKLFGTDIKIENCSPRLMRSNKKSNFWKSSFFSNSSELWRNIYRAWRKTFRQGYQKWKLYYMSSEYQFEDKNSFLKVL